MSALPNAHVIVRGVPAAEGHDVHLVPDAAEARRLFAEGKAVIGPELWSALADVSQIFPGARVVELRRNQGAKK
jgi:hypothetical protein